MVGVTEVSRMEGEHERGGVLDGGDGLPRATAMTGAPVNPQVGLQQAAFGNAELEVGRLGDQARVSVDQTLLEQGPVPKRPPRSSSATRWNTMSQAGETPARSRVVRAQMAAAMPPFMSALPRPYRRPDSTAGVNGSRLQPPGSTGTTSR